MKPREQVVKAVPAPPTTGSLWKTGRLSWDCASKARNKRTMAWEMGRTRTKLWEDVISRTAHWSYVLPSSHCRDFHLVIPCLNLYEFNLGLENDGWNTEAWHHNGWNTEAWRHDERLWFRDKLAGICFHSAVSPPLQHTLPQHAPHYQEKWVSLCKVDFPKPAAALCHGLGGGAQPPLAVTPWTESPL